MSRGWKLFTIAVAAAAILFTATLLTLSWWLPRLAGFWLPAATSIRLDGNLRWQAGALSLPGIRYLQNECELAKVDELRLGRHAGRWALNAKRLQIDSTCFSALPASQDRPATPRSLAEWQAMLPQADVTVEQLIVAPWQQWAGSLRLSLAPHRQVLTWRGKDVALQASLKGQQLAIESLTLYAKNFTRPVNLKGQLVLPKIPETLPESGALSADLQLQSIPMPLQVSLNWRQNGGALTIQTQDKQEPLLRLPWQVTPRQITVSKGQWRWPAAAQPLSGGVTLSLENWQEGLSATTITGRVNVLTQGRGGKGNIVLSVGPGHLDPTHSALPFRLTGTGKLAQLLFFTAIPGELQGPVFDPVLRLEPGALLRMRGRLLTTMEVDEARWPLAGLTVSSAGIDGRLQAILSAHDPQMGQFRLHLDGRASDFWPDKGEWRWHYWGNGVMAPLAAKWYVKGQGFWQDKLIELTSMSADFDQIYYVSTRVQAPGLLLTAPLRWRRDNDAPSFTGGVSLNTQRTDFTGAGYLPPAELSLAITGSSPDAFQLNGSLAAKPIGPITVRGRWDGQRLRGELWWPSQSLDVFQPLLNDKLEMTIRGGTLRAQVAFSAAADQGLSAGGNWVVSNGSVRMPDNDISGINFSLPFRLHKSQWYFGAKGPVSLRIKQIKNQFLLENIRADLQGYYPWSPAQPLRLSNVGVATLGGEVSLVSLQMPQTEAATLRLRHISMSELVTAIQPKKIALSGAINGALPLWLENSPWLVKGGWIANSGPLTLRLDKDFADALSENVATGAAISWLRYMEISHSWGTLDIDRNGEMSLKAQVNGLSRYSNKNQRVTLNYTQQENLFQLWRSLRFGDNLQSWIEQNSALATQGKTE